MAQTSVSQFASELKMPAASLLEQLAKAGVGKKGEADLLSDADETACKLFNVIKMKNMYGKKVRGIERSTFVIDRKGMVRREWRGVKVPGHVQEVLEFVKTLA